MDTVRLKIPRKLPVGSPYFQEKVHMKELQTEHLKGSRFVYTNNTGRKEQIAKGIYTPKYWIEEDFKNPAITYFCLEASIPKMLFGENMTELETNHFTEAVRAIQTFSKTIRINLFEREILKAVPTLLAVGRNINITKLCSCYSAIKALSLFNDRFRSELRVVMFEADTGMELIFSNKSTTFKAYDKIRQIQRKPITAKEHEIAGYLRKERYKQNEVYIREMLRFELTMKNKTALNSKLKPYLNEKTPTFKNVFNKDLWNALITKEIDEIYDHPLKDFVFIALEEKPKIDALLDVMHKQVKVKHGILGIVNDIQAKGLKQTRQDMFEGYQSKQTWYNYVHRLQRLEKHIDYTALQNLSQLQIHEFILKQFGIETRRQGLLNLNFAPNHTKNIE